MFGKNDTEIFNLLINEKFKRKRTLTVSFTIIYLFYIYLNINSQYNEMLLISVKFFVEIAKEKYSSS